MGLNGCIDFKGFAAYMGTKEGHACLSMFKTIINPKFKVRCTDCPASSISGHVTVDLYRRCRTPWIDGVHSAGCVVVMAMDVITVDGQIILLVRVN